MSGIHDVPVRWLQLEKRILSVRDTFLKPLRERRGIGRPPRSARVHAFNSRLSSFKKRQSVPSAMIFCGLDLIMPISCKRSA